jgi:hypothetical protein
VTILKTPSYVLSALPGVASGGAKINLPPLAAGLQFAQSNWLHAQLLKSKVIEAYATGAPHIFCPQNVTSISF